MLSWLRLFIWRHRRQGVNFFLINKRFFYRIMYFSISLSACLKVVKQSRYTGCVGDKREYAVYLYVYQVYRLYLHAPSVDIAPTPLPSRPFPAHPTCSWAHYHAFTHPTCHPRWFCAVRDVLRGRLHNVRHEPQAIMKAVHPPPGNDDRTRWSRHGRRTCTPSARKKTAGAPAAKSWTAWCAASCQRAVARSPRPQGSAP